MNDNIKYPRGYPTDAGSARRIAVRFPDELFDIIIAMAKKEKPPKDFNGMVLELVKCGKLCLDESDRLEP